MSIFFSSDEWLTLVDNLPNLPFATWETFYATVLSTLLAMVIGLPLGVLLVVGEKDGILPLPRWLMAVINTVINLLRSVPFLILMIAAIPLSRLIMGTSIGTLASIVPLVVASFPFVARLVETSLREVDGGVIEAAQSMGATPFQIISRVMVPESLPSLIANVTIALTTILGYSAMAGIIGGGGLGQIAINYGRICGVFYGSYAALQNLMKIKARRVDISCDFLLPKTREDISFTLKLRLGSILWAALCMGGRFLVYTIRRGREELPSAEIKDPPEAAPSGIQK